ncbi:Pol polyprotein [Vitis vinifera]|uniref:Pol polyprotein n=1 Tax=Vitis vinifera TaxID=29760 RepID=A0A438JF81_VITVI|nr:Pol polyprotein [Vitis vinifera]
MREIAASLFRDVPSVRYMETHSRASELHALTSPWPFSVWGIDIIGKISPKSSSGHEFILVAIDYFTKWVEAASYARLTSSGVASFIRSHIICRYGVPHELISDRGVHFRAEVDTLVQRYSIRHHRSSAYRPQTNGAVEAANKNIKRILRRMVETSRDWSEKLPFALWAYRTSFRTSTGATPYSLVYGMEAMLPVEIEMGSLRVALEQQIPEADWAQARFDQLNLLDERRLRAADHVRAYQRKMARAFKKRGVDPRGRCMVDGFRWKPILRANQCGSAKEVLCLRPWSQDGWPSFRDPSRVRYFASSLHISLQFILLHLSPYRYHIHVRHSQVHGSWGSLYMLHFIYEGMSFDHWVFEPSFLSFLSPYHLGLRYVPCLKTTLRPWDQMSSSEPLLGQCYGIPPEATRYMPQAGTLRTSRWKPISQPYGAIATSAARDESGVASLMCRSDSVVFRLPGSFMDPHGLARSSLTGCSPRRGHDRYLTEPLRSMQPGPHFSTLGCHHASSSGRSMFDFILSGCSEEPLMSHSARFIPFDIVVILGWSCLRCLDFPRHHFRRVHIRSVTRPIGVVLGSSGQIGGESFETRRVPFSHFQRIEICSGIPPSLSLSGLLCTSSLLNPFLDLCESSYWGISPLALFYWGIPPLFGFTVSRVDFMFDVQSHHHHFSVSAFRAIIVFSVSAFRAIIGFQINIQSHHHHFSAPAFRVIITFRFRRSEPSPCFQFGVQSHHRFSDRHLESHPRFRLSESLSLLSLTFMIIVTFQFRHSEPSSVFRSTFRVASSISTFRAIITSSLTFRAIFITSQFWLSEPSSLFSLAFRAIITSSLAFRAIIAFQFWRSEPSLFSVLAFRAIIAFQFWCSEPSLFQFGVQSHYHYFQCGVQSHHRFSVLAFIVITIFGLGFQSHHCHLV